MRSYLELGPVPVLEECVQVGSDNYKTMVGIECRAYIGQLRRVFGQEPKGAEIRIKSFPHDLGTYHEVVCYYEEGDNDSTEYAFKLESNLPEYWDSISKAQIEENKKIVKKHI